MIKLNNFLAIYMIIEKLNSCQVLLYSHGERESNNAATDKRSRTMAVSRGVQ